MRYFSYILVISTLVVSIKCFGQNYIDLIKFSTQSTPHSNFNGSSESTRINELNIELTTPVQLSTRNIWLSNMAFERLEVRLFESQNYESLYSFTLRTGLNMSHSSKITGTYLLAPRISSTRGSSFSESFQFGGLMLYKFLMSEQSNFKLGILVHSDFFSPFVTPLIGYYRLSTSGKWEINALLPSTFNLNRVLTKDLDVGLNFNGQVKGYHFDQVSSTGESGYMVRSSNELCGYIKLRVAKNIFLQARTGLSIGRSYRVYDGNDKIDLAISFIKINDNRVQLNSDFKNGMVGQVGLFYRLPLN